MCLCFKIELCKLIDISKHSKCEKLGFKIYASAHLNPGPLAPKGRIILHFWYCNEQSSGDSLFLKGNMLYLFTLNSTHFSLCYYKP